MHLAATDGNGNTTSTTYDAQNRPLVTTNPDSTTVTKTYNNAKNTMSVTNEMGVTL
ncbi:MAG TPA: hypothetical protein PKH29_12460 [Oscillospiraceae bacterium]|nr:hypothetical protein [Oscillospiraceae bacterium]